MVNPNSEPSPSGIGAGLDRPLVLGISLVVLLIIGSAILSAYDIQQLRSDSARVDHTHQVIAALESIMETVRDAESAQRAFIITGEAAYLDPYRDAAATAEDAVKRVTELVADNPQQQARLPKLRERIAARLDTLFANARLREQENFDAAKAAIATDKGKRRWTRSARPSTKCSTPNGRC